MIYQANAPVHVSAETSDGMNRFSLRDLSDAAAEQIIELAYHETGIRLNMAKKPMMISRLNKRLDELGIDTFEEYVKYLQKNGATSHEFSAFVDAISTNKTAFFRENDHFEYLTANVLPTYSVRSGRNVSIWSAGCSTGKEPYTLAMVCAEYFADSKGFEILASDISQAALKSAIIGVYPKDKYHQIPDAFQKKYLLKGVGSQSSNFRITPEIRARIRFKTVNLVDETWELPQNVSIIFCRNVMIYFDKATRQSIISRMYDILPPEGWLFIGHSETLNDLDHQFTAVRPTIYVKRSAAK